MRTYTVGKIGCALMVVCIVGAGCRRQGEDTRAKSVEALQAGSSDVKRGQVCGGPPKEITGFLVQPGEGVQFEKEQIKAYTSEVKKVLSMSPQIVLGMLLSDNPLSALVVRFHDMKRKTPSALCGVKTGNNAKEESNQIEFSDSAACWTREGQKHVIHLFTNNPTEESLKNAIHSYLLVEIGFIVDAWRMALESLTPDTDEGQKLVAAHRNCRESLIKSLLQDNTEIKTDQAVDESMVFAEAFDAYYCSEKTNETFKSQLPNTFNAFAGCIQSTEPVATGK